MYIIQLQKKYCKKSEISPLSRATLLTHAFSWGWLLPEGWGADHAAGPAGSAPCPDRSVLCLEISVMFKQQWRLPSKLVVMGQAQSQTGKSVHKVRVCVDQTTHHTICGVHMQAGPGCGWVAGWCCSGVTWAGTDHLSWAAVGLLGLWRANRRQKNTGQSLWSLLVTRLFDS